MKKGQTELMMVIGNVVIILIAFGILLNWINDKSSGKAFSDDFIAKQIALVIDSARPGSSIYINEKFKINGNKVIFGSSNYETFVKEKISYSNTEKGTLIEVGNE